MIAPLCIADLTIDYCRGCGTCRVTGECVMQDDMDRVVASDPAK